MITLPETKETMLLRNQLDRIQEWGCTVDIISNTTSYPYIQINVKTPNQIEFKAFACADTSVYKMQGVTFIHVTSSPGDGLVDTSVHGIPFITEICRKIIYKMNTIDHELTPCCF